MKKLIEFFKENDFTIWMLLVLMAFLGTIIGILCYMECAEDERRDAVARLETRYKYTIVRWHAGSTSYMTLYYTNAYEIDGPLVKFKDHEGHNVLVSGDVTIVENNKNYDSENEKI